MNLIALTGAITGIAARARGVRRVELVDVVRGPFGGCVRGACALPKARRFSKP